MMSNGRLVRGNGRKRKGVSMGGNEQLFNLEQMFSANRTSRLSAPSSSAGHSGNAQQKQILCVKWDKFNSNLVSVFSRLRNQGHFIDVLLWCEGKTVKCHKIVLCAGSSYFQNLLVEHPDPGDPLPIIFLNNMSFWEVEALVDFMYNGVVNVPEDKLQNLLDAAEALKIKGLGPNQESNSSATATSGSVGGSIFKPSRNQDGPMDMSTSTTTTKRPQSHSNIPNFLQNNGLFKTVYSNDIKLNGNGQWNHGNNFTLGSNYILGPDVVSQVPGNNWPISKGRSRKKSTPMRVSTSTSSASPGLEDDGVGPEIEVEVEMDEGASGIEDLTLQRGRDEAE